MNKYIIEEFDIIQQTGKGFLNTIYTNKQKAIKDAKKFQSILCKNDKKHIIYIVNKIIKNEEFEEVFETKNK